jgi:hypothetical protein
MELSRREKLGFLLINMGLHKFKHCHAKIAFKLGNSIT